jgi:hypothetical protein
LPDTSPKDLKGNWIDCIRQGAGEVVIIRHKGWLQRLKSK